MKTHGFNRSAIVRCISGISVKGLITQKNEKSLFSRKQKTGYRAGFVVLEELSKLFFVWIGHGLPRWKPSEATEIILCVL